MKVLLLSCNTGEGHNSAGRAICAALLEKGAEVEMLSALDFASKGYSNLICAVHTQTYLKATRFYGNSYDAFERMRGKKGASFAYCLNAIYAQKLYRYIVSKGFDTVIATHVFPAEALTYIRRRYPVNFNAYFVATDYTCSPFVDETEMDAYFIPHGDLAEEFAAKGIDPDRLIATGIPVSESFAARVGRADARKALGLPENGRRVLLMSGSMGAGPVEKLTHGLLAALPDTAAVSVLCGRNGKLRQNLQKSCGADRRLEAVGFTRDVSLYMDACDALITKAGGLTSTEAAVKGIPLVHMNAVPGCEERNIQFFTGHGMSVAGTRVEEIAGTTAELLHSPGACEKMVERQRETVCDRAAEKIAEMVETLPEGGLGEYENLKEA